MLQRETVNAVPLNRQSRRVSVSDENFPPRSYRIEESLLNIVKLNQIWIVIKLFKLVRHQMEFCLVINQLKKCDYNKILDLI